MAPPLPAFWPLLSVKPFKVRMPAAATEKIFTLTVPLAALTIKFPGAGAVIPIFVLIVGRTVTRLIVQTPAEQPESDVGIAKVMLSAFGLVFAS